MPRPSVGRAHQVRDVELRLAEERVGAGRLQLDDRAQQHADRGLREPAVLLERRLALVRREELQRRAQVGQVEQRQPLVVAVGEDERQDRDLRLVQVEHLAEQDRPEGRDRGAHLRAECAREREQLDGMAPRLVRDAELLRPLHDGTGRRVAGLREPREVALHVAHEHRHSGVGELAGQDLQGLRLPRAGRAGHEAVAVHHRQGKPHGRARRDLAVEHRRPEQQRRLVERVPLGHLLEEGLVHRGREPSGAAPVASGGDVSARGSRRPQDAAFAMSSEHVIEQRTIQLVHAHTVPLGDGVRRVALAHAARHQLPGLVGTGGHVGRRAAPAPRRSPRRPRP